MERLHSTSVPAAPEQVVQAQSGGSHPPAECGCSCLHPREAWRLLFPKFFFSFLQLWTSVLARMTLLGHVDNNFDG